RVQADRPGPRVNPAMWGIFFEDINLGADGGLYAELVKNRSFEFPDGRGMMGWFEVSPTMAKGRTSLADHAAGGAANRRFLRLQSEGTAPFGVSYEGFRGMGLRKGETYDFSADLRVTEGAPRVTVELVGSDGSTLASGRLEGGSPAWKQQKLSLQPNDTDAKSRLNVIVDGAGTVEIDMVSLFPRKTWKDRPGGLRADMVQTLADLHPGFLRFPGGCIVEGARLDVRYQWQKTIGPIEDRELLVNRWNYEFKHRPTPDYYQTFGLGFYEYFQLAEDIGAEPLPILGCGMACQFNSGELVPMDALGPYIQEALDLIEFANGAVTTPWGKKRAELGHPEPFEMKMLGIGNEQWGPQYVERYAAFHQAVKAKHPEIALVSAAGPSPQDERFHYLWPELRKLNADIVDEHCYANPIWFLSNSDRYDGYDRQGPKVFFGEYAAQSDFIVSTKNKNNLETALSEAAFMTGLERNADVVRMASYAPLFAHVDGWQWTPDLIWVDNLRVLRTPNYYVQQLFSRNRGDVVLPVSTDAPVKELLPAGRIALGTRRASGEFKDVRVTSGTATLLAPGFAAGWSGGEGWSLAAGAYRQPDAAANGTVRAGDVGWKDYTLALKARKLGGEGGLVVTVYDDGAGARADWNLGAQGNTKHAIVTQYAQQAQLVAETPGSIQAGRWYDVKVVVRGRRMECYLDGTLVQSGEVLPRQVRRVYASATRDEATRDIILKVVNPGEEATEVAVQIGGASRIAGEAQATVLTGAGNDVVNSFDAPAAIAPVTEKIAGVGPDFRHRFPARSMTVLRIGTAAP
ncbi:MAG: alpha-L-arabinofuranosidase C-terminal domain-containing protein, partial [Vicinamibacteria bacterium]